jgi:SecD/SecF fusion protein
LLPVTALLLFGGDTLKDFAFALLVGIASGTYSSIFIASPVLTAWKEREAAYVQRRRRIVETLGIVPAYAVATVGGPPEPPSPVRSSTRQRRRPEPEPEPEPNDASSELVSTDGADGADVEPAAVESEPEADGEAGHVNDADTQLVPDAPDADGAPRSERASERRAERKKRARQQRRRKHGRRR